MIQKIPERITFNKTTSMVVFSENNIEYSKPFILFNKLLISGKISHSENSSSLTYQLNLVSTSGSNILLCESSEKNDLQKTAESIVSYLDIDILSGADLLHKGEGRYNNSQPVYPPLNSMSIKKETNGNISLYQWNSRKSLVSLFLLGAVIFGFNFVFFTWAVPSLSSFNLGIYVGGFILVIMNFFFIITLIFNTFGSNIAEVSDTAFSYRQKIFGFSINKKSFNKSEIGMISSGFTSDENKITIFTKRGTDIINEMKVFASLNNLNDKSLLMTLIPKVMEMRNNIIEIDGTPLYYYEKLYLENEWSEKLQLGTLK